LSKAIIAVTQKRCNIVCNLALITNRKSHAGFPLVRQSVTVNDLERRNGRLCVISANSVCEFDARYLSDSWAFATNACSVYLRLKR